MPDFQFDETPNPVAVIPKPGTVLRKESLDSFWSEEPALCASRFQQQELQIIQLRPCEPILPGSREPHFLAMHDRFGEQIFYRLFQDELARHPCNGILGRDFRRELHQHMM